MVFRRKGRPTLYFQARDQYGYRLLSTGVKVGERDTAKRVVRMWESLADVRAWDVLAHVHEGPEGLTVARLYDKWMHAKKNVSRLRMLLTDLPLAKYRDDFLAWYRAQGVKPDTVSHVETHLDVLLERELTAFGTTTEILTSALTAYKGSPATRRKVHADWSTFFGYCTTVHKLFATNPMLDVAKPAVTKRPPEYYEIEDVEKIIGYFPDARRRALFAFAYGTAIDVSQLPTIARADVNPAEKETRASGTKTSTRDRIARIADWAWPTFWEYAKTIHHHTPIFAGMNRWTISDWHRRAVRKLELSKRYPLRNARHHWAVRMLRGGAPIRMVQEQLGHATAQLTLDLYGRFIPSGADRSKWEKTVARYDTRRRQSMKE